MNCLSTVWTKSWLVALAVSATMLVGYERYCRHLGYEPSIQETADAWIDRWQLAIRGRAVLLGNSRCLAALRPEVLAPMFDGEPPAQLCAVGVNELDVLDQLANHTRFSGTAIVEIVPGVAFVQPTDEGWAELARTFELRPIYAGFEEDIVLALQGRGAMFIRSASPLVWLRRLRRLNPATLDHQSVAVRPDGVHIPVGDPEFLKHMWPDGVPWAQSIQRGYEHRLNDEELERRWSSTRRTVETLEARGGQVIFLRLPVTGSTREAEDTYFPREKYWDRLVRETRAIGVYCADHAALQGFEEPDESHIDPRLAPEFTRRLAAILTPLINARRPASHR